MKKRITIKNRPLRLPVVSTVLTYLCMDYWKAPEWFWGVMAVLFLVLWIIVIIDIVTRVEIDLFEDADPKDVRKSFQERVKEYKEKREQNSKPMP